MITLVEALNYRSLRYIRRPLNSFHVLIGPNASGKTNFLDVLGFLSDLVSDGLEAAVSERSQNPGELLFDRRGGQFELAVEARIPDELRRRIWKPDLDSVRYEVGIGYDDEPLGFEFKNERLLLKRTKVSEESQHPLLPEPSAIPSSLLSNIRSRANKTIINRVPGGNENFYSETHRPSGRGRTRPLRLWTQGAALSNLPAASRRFSVAIWFRAYVTAGIRRLALNSRAIKHPSPPGGARELLPDGSNLPWVAARLRQEDPERYGMWIAHLRTVLDGLEDVVTIERPQDKHCCMVYRYAGGLEVPSWLASDGDLRLTALTLPAYLTGLEGTYLIEEPENGIHSRALQTAYESLSSMYDSQVLLTTYSPVLLNNADIDHVLCFAKDDTGATKVVPGAEHPNLSERQRTTDLGTLFASGALE